jgi:hypothetical protein
MKKHIAELTGAALDWAVHQAWCEGACHDEPFPSYSTDWAQGGPIIEREAITIEKVTSSLWVARSQDLDLHVYGQTALIAAMRLNGIAYFGLTIDIPEELTGETA